MFSVNPFSKKPFSNGSGNPAITYGYNINNYNNPFGNPSTSLGLEGSVTLPNYQDFADEIINSITSLTSRSERDNPTAYYSGNVGGNDNKKNDLLGPISSDRAKEIANSTQNLIKETFSKNKDEDEDEGSVTLPNYQKVVNQTVNTSVGNVTGNTSQSLITSNQQSVQPTSLTNSNGTLNTTIAFGNTPTIDEKKLKSIIQSAVRNVPNLPTKMSFSEKFSESTFGKNFGTWSAGLNMANNLFTTFAGEKSEYSGTKGGLVRGIDSAYDTVQSVVSSFGPIGQFASLIMGGNKLLGNVANKLGAGTSGNTPIDAILNSSFLQLTPFGMINGFGGKKTMSFTKDNLAFAQVGSGYTGTSANVDDALSKANKKYGLFSLGALGKANDKIIDASRQQQIMSNVADTASDRFALSDSMAAINNSKMALNLMGGYDQSSVRVGKAGMILQLAREINSKPSVLKEITEIPTEFLEVPEFKEGGTIQKKTRSLEELIQYAKESNPRFIQRLSEAPKGIDFIDDEGNQARGSHYLAYSTDNKGNAIIYPRIQEIDGELKLLNDEDAYNRARENKNNLIMTVDEAKIFFKEDPEFGTAYKKGWPEFFKKFQNGGILQEVTEIPTEFLEIDEFKKGGKFNIIPEGALHARKHNMDVENITQKGIPVVSESADGEIIQQAEIERQEIIFRLEVTKKLEELAKDGSDEAAIEAGKLLVQEILYNTIDNTNTLL